MNWLHFGVARGGKFPFIVGALGLLWMLHGVGWAAIGVTFDAPQDDLKVRRMIEDRPELKPVATELDDLVETRLWPLTPEEIDQFFGPQLAVPPLDMVLPVFSAGGGIFSGATPIGIVNKRHQELHAIGDIGYVEFYYNWDGSVATGVIYHRADRAFVPLTSGQDFLKRLEWDKMKFEGIQKWLAAHLPKITDFGEVVVVDHTPRRLHLANGKVYLATASVDFEDSFTVQLMVDTPNAAEQDKSVLYKVIRRPDEPIAFQVDGHFYRLTPELKSKPTKRNLGVVVLSESAAIPLDVGPGRECLVSLRKHPDGHESIYLAVMCKSYSQGITPLIDADGSVTFPIDGNIVSFTPKLPGK